MSAPRAFHDAIRDAKRRITPPRPPDDGVDDGGRDDEVGAELADRETGQLQDQLHRALIVDPLERPHDPPRRIQLRRTKGWRKPEGAIVVARPSKWGNPWAVVPALPRMYRFGPFDVIHRERYSSLGRFADDLSSIPGTGARYWAAKGYGLHLQEHPDLREAAIRELRGHDLACWCPLDAPCHADVLLRLANPEQAP